MECTGTLYASHHSLPVDQSVSALTELQRSHFAYTFKAAAFPISEIIFSSFIMRIDIKRVFWS